MLTVYIKGQMNTSAEKLWGSLEKFDLNYFRGFPHTLDGEGVGATRKFDMGKGEIAEQVEKHDSENMTLTYTVLYGPLPVQSYHATIKVMPGDRNSCELEWSAIFEPKDTTEEEARETIEGMFKMNVKALNKFHAHS